MSFCQVFHGQTRNRKCHDVHNLVLLWMIDSGRFKCYRNYQRWSILQLVHLILCLFLTSICLVWKLSGFVLPADPAARHPAHLLMPGLLPLIRFSFGSEFGFFCLVCNLQHPNHPSEDDLLPVLRPLIVRLRMSRTTNLHLFASGPPKPIFTRLV